MKNIKYIITLSLIVSAISLTPTSTLRADGQAGKGLFGGALGGATLGGIIGGGRGAAIGAGVGGAVGLISGAAAESNERRRYKRGRYVQYEEPIEYVEYQEEPVYVYETDRNSRSVKKRRAINNEDVEYIEVNAE